MTCMSERSRTTPVTLNVNFGVQIYSGSGAAPSCGTIWNRMGLDEKKGLVDSYGIATGIDIVVFATDIGTYGDPADLSMSPLLGQGIENAATGENPVRVTINGLNPNSRYDLYIFGSSPYSKSKYSVGQKSDFVDGGNMKNVPPFVYHTDYAKLEQVETAGGVIVINANRWGTDSQTVSISGFQLLEVPPPAPVIKIIS